MLHPSIPSVSPIPAPRQIAWQSLETTAFLHFGPNTFTDKEWGGGDEDPNLFNPSDLDCDQWVRELKATGFKGVIITAKHHDGFCLWPSKFSTHTVAQSKWKGGKGDVLRELSDACHRHHMRLGVYLSPWDRNHPAYGTAQYNQIFANMLTEVLTHYGPIFEVWFDGANGEGPNGKKQVYDWTLFHSVVRKYQPDAVMFSDAGPDIRWVGNESGEASPTSWSMIPGNRYVPGTPLFAELGEGREDGDQWVAPECDVSIRPGWFYHPSEESQNKTPDQLLDLFEKSVGRNSLLLLNVPPDRRGHLTDGELTALRGFHNLRESVYGQDLAKPGTLYASSELSADHRPERLRHRGFWAPALDDKSPTLTCHLPRPTRINRVLLAEPIVHGQRVRQFEISVRLESGTWTSVATGTTIGHQRILPFDPVTATDFRVTINSSRSLPLISQFAAHFRPPSQ
jgi:alpha-L-fucosidase